ncbi:MAG TPA: hypothetical protein VEX39_10860 [Thermoleophilaceae bacterium]|nr:hypothetical protein [Thermoleophilaceae bacterium]
MSAGADAQIAGPAHVATVSFLASRAVPSGGFVVALAGGTALARVGARHGARTGFGASLAAMLETVAIMGPARFGVPLTQAVSAPLMGAMYGRARGPGALFAVALAIRLVSNAIGIAFFIFVITGGLDAYAGTYENIAGKVGISVGERGTLILTAIGLVGWGVLASIVQVVVYLRGLRSWPEAAMEGEPPPDEAAAHSGRFDPRAATLAAAVAFALLLSGTEWPLLAGVAVWLALVTATAGGDRRAWRTGLILAGALGLGAVVFSLTGGLGTEVAARRGLRAVLLVLVATWLRSAAGAEGLREVFRRTLGRLRRVPAVPEAIRALDHIGSEGHLARAGRSLVTLAAETPLRPSALVDTVLEWVYGQAGRFRAAPPPAALVLRVRVVDAAMVLAAALPAAALVAA